MNISMLLFLFLFFKNRYRKQFDKSTKVYVGDFQAYKRKKEISGRWMHKIHKGVNNRINFQKLHN